MAIVMLASFYPGELPRIPDHQPYPVQDIGSYEEAWTAAKYVSENCISPYFLKKKGKKDHGLGELNFTSDTGFSEFGMYTDLVAIVPSYDLASG